jgi:hypothetical protein
MMYVIYGVAAFYTVLAWRFLVIPFWPWDWKGTRKEIKLKGRNHDWHDDDD